MLIWPLSNYKRTAFVLLVLVCVVRGFSQGTNFVPLVPLFGEGALTVSLDAGHANPPNSSWFTGTATWRLDGHLLSYLVATTGPFFRAVDIGAPLVDIYIQGPTTVTDLPWAYAGFSDPTYDLIAYLPGTAPPPEVVYRDFFGGSLTLSDLQRSELLSGQSLLTVDFGQYGSIAGQIVVVPEPSEYALLFSGAAAIGWYLRRDKKARDETRV